MERGREGGREGGYVKQIACTLEVEHPPGGKSVGECMEAQPSTRGLGLVTVVNDPIQQGQRGRVVEQKHLNSLTT